jgi:predicted transcriptional regulator
MVLKEFQKEHNEMSETLYRLLDKGEAIRIKEFKKMIKNIRLRQIERGKEVKAKLDEFRKERKDMASQWNNLMVDKAKKRAEVKEEEVARF